LSSPEPAPPACQPPDPHPHAPGFALPPGACDAHAHVFGHPPRYPFRPGRRYTPAAPGLAEYRHVLATLGIAHAVIVQPDLYFDNQVTADALIAAGGAWRGIAKLYPDMDDGEIARLHRIGFRGVRLNGRPGADGLRDMETVAARIAPFGWHIQVHMFAADLPREADRFAALPVPVVFDHFCRPDTDLGVGQDGFRALLDLVGDGKCWAKLSAPNRFAEERPPYAALVPFAHALIAAAPGRLVWGSDWPHSSHEGFMPNDGDLLDLLTLWAPDRTVRDAILHGNPAALYGFAAPSRSTAP
jgi:2-pyrone-4,6-dicarboxylate lactonase